MIIKKNKKRSYTFFGLIFFCILLLVFTFPKITTKKIKVQLHSINEWITGFDLGYSSINNITNDGSIKFQTDYNQSVSNKVFSFLTKTPNIIYYKLNSFFSPNFETLYLDINMENFETILNDRNKVMNTGHAIENQFEEVPGYLWFNGNKKRMRVRLKGILETHWLTKRRMSLKIELLNGETILGYNEFSIQKPRERQWPYNYVFEKMSEDIGILSTNSNFVNVIVNGEKWGIMLIEESLGKVYLENKRKKESLIFKFGDEREWYEGWTQNPFYLYRLGDSSLFYHVYTLAKNLCKDTEQLEDFTLVNNNKNRQIISYVMKNIRDYNNDIYYQDKLTKAFYLSEIWGNLHALLNNNTSYYLNPYSLKLEPIIRDQYAFEQIKSKNDLQQWPPPTQFLMSLKNTQTSEKYKIINEIEKSLPLAKKEFNYAKKIFPIDTVKNTTSLGSNLNTFKVNESNFINFNPNNFYKKIENGIVLDHKKLLNICSNFSKYNDDKKIIKSEIPERLCDEINLDKLKELVISKELEDAKPFQNTDQIKRISEQVYFEHYTNGEIEIFNLLPDEVTIHEINFKDNNLLNSKIIIPSYLSSKKSVIFQSDIKGIQDGNFTLVSSYKIKKSISKNKISLIKDVKNPLINPTIIPSFIEKVGNDFVIPQGEWNIKDDIVLEGNLNISPGTHIKFSENVSMIIKGTIKAVGEDDKKIIFNSAGDKWNGLYVYGGSKTSFLSNVIFKNTSSINEGILELTGGIVFYKSPVNMKNITFENSKGEDALNIIDTTFKIENVEFNNSISDAFDSDYSSGTIINTKFKDIGGDALDFSGSNVIVKKMSALRVKDKAISVGEKSNLNISDINLKEVGVGVASKDGSIAIINNCNIEDPSVAGLMTYIKKKNYSYPSLKALNCNINFKKFSELNDQEKKNKQYFRQIGSYLKVDQIKNIPSKSLNVDLLYSSTVMKKNKTLNKCNAI